ncbi:MAG TPA: substrate-binding domain-containing protein [Bacteroidales bacterium]|nr:substrate-binding domain-containing protein [Bacteroidales bacterium]
MQKRLLRLFSVICIGLLGLYLVTGSCSNRGSQDEKHRPRKIIPYITITGSLELYPLLSQLAFEFNRIYPDVRIDVTPGSSIHNQPDICFRMMDSENPANTIKEGSWDTSLISMPLAYDAILPFGNKTNPYLEKLKSSGITQNQFRYIFLDATLDHWGQLTKADSSYQINPFTRTDLCESGEIWSSFLGTDQSHLTGTGVYGEAGMVMAVRKNTYSIGYASMRYIYDRKTFEPMGDLAVIPIDLDKNGKIDIYENFFNNLEDLSYAIKRGSYPSPPARTLFIIFGRPPVNKLVNEFIIWIFENGRQTIEDAGYVAPDENIINKNITRINDFNQLP